MQRSYGEYFLMKKSLPGFLNQLHQPFKEEGAANNKKSICFTQQQTNNGKGGTKRKAPGITQPYSGRVHIEIHESQQRSDPQGDKHRQREIQKGNRYPPKGH